MIIDSLCNLENYASVHALMPEVLAFINRTDLGKLAVGRYEIDGTSIYAMVSDENGRSVLEAPLEAHREYIDLQVCVKGRESFGWHYQPQLKTVKQAYDANKDIEFYGDAPMIMFDLFPGHFVIFDRSDAHAPLYGEKYVRKIVIKIKK